MGLVTENKSHNCTLRIQHGVNGQIYGCVSLLGWWNRACNS